MEYIFPLKERKYTLGNLFDLIYNYLSEM